MGKFSDYVHYMNGVNDFVTYQTLRLKHEVDVFRGETSCESEAIQCEILTAIARELAQIAIDISFKYNTLGCKDKSAVIDEFLDSLKKDLVK